MKVCSSETTPINHSNFQMNAAVAAVVVVVVVVVVAAAAAAVVAFLRPHGRLLVDR